MTQNIYDNPEFFAGYSQLLRSVEGLDGAPEWPSLQAKLPAMDGLRVVDLGCGFGWFCRWAESVGAASVRGLDVSEKMLERAGADTDGMTVVYERSDLETLMLAEDSIDLAYSSLTLHYLANLPRLFAVVHRALVPGGHFVFSVEHPIFTAPSTPQWTDHPDGHRIWPVDDYLAEGPRTTEWLAPGVVKQHRTVGTYVTLLVEAGFTITHLEEWGPSDAQITAHPEWANERDRPPFLLLACDAR